MTETHKFSLNSPLFSPVKNGPKSDANWTTIKIRGIHEMASTHYDDADERQVGKKEIWTKGE